jgi:prepilin-type N-terminal cleavage/methylation domain-containing protein
MQKWAQKSGFTIVELLIVIVVIAILAAITIVAYNGIQNRAKDSAVNTATSQAGRKVLAYAPTNTDRYPTEANFADATFRTSTLALPADTNAATYDYYASDDQKSFCLSVTNTTTSPITAYAMTQSGQIVQGRCVKNLAVDPEAVTGNFSSVGSSPAATQNQVMTDRFHSGTTSYRRLVQGTGQLAAIATGFTIPVQAGERLNYSFWIYSTKAGTLAMYVEGNNGAGGGAGFSGGASVSIPANAWTKVTGSGSPGSFANAQRVGGYNLQVVSGDTVWIDEVMITKNGSETIQYGFGGGDSLNWSWTGAPNNSASFGPAVPQ